VGILGDNSGASAAADAPVSVLLKRRWVIILTTALVTAVALFLSIQQTPQYTSTSSVLVDPTLNQTTTTTVNMANEKQVAGSVAVAESVVQRLHLPISPLRLLDNLSVDVPVDSDILTFSFTDPDPLVAQRTTAAFVSAYIDFRERVDQQEYDFTIDSVRRQVSSLTGQLRQVEALLAQNLSPTQRALEGAKATSLITQIGILQQRVASLASPDQAQTASVLNAANLPRSPSRPNYPINVALGLVAGLCLGVIGAILLERFDDRVRGRQDVERILGVPVLGVVPRIKGLRKTGPLVVEDRPNQPEAEAFRHLRANLILATTRHRAHIVLVTSATPGEGKTLVVANLGMSLALSGLKVLLVSADLRNPQLDSAFGQHDRRGLSDLLLDRITVEDAVFRTRIPNLSIVVSGSVDGETRESFTGSHFENTLRQLAQQVDIVLIDSAPLLAVADVSAMGPACDALLFVADARSAGRRDLAEAQHQLSQIGTPTIGSVITNARSETARTYTYPTSPSEKVKTHRRGRQGSPKSLVQAGASANGGNAGNGEPSGH